MMATAGGLVIGGGGDLALHAIDAATGAELWHAALPRRVNATPMTYRTANGRQIVVTATGGGEDAALVAFALGTTGSDVGPPFQGAQGGLKGRPYTDDRRMESSRGGK
jgi:outer membrane protein assembly factor BamB